MEGRPDLPSILPQFFHLTQVNVKPLGRIQGPNFNPAPIFSFGPNQCKLLGLDCKAQFSIHVLLDFLMLIKKIYKNMHIFFHLPFFPFLLLKKSIFFFYLYLFYFRNRKDNFFPFF